jgi:PPP family 3-phenylpropionic acid transporter
MLLVAAALIQGSHATFYNLSTMHWEDHGISKTVAGALWAEGILAEIVLFFVAPWTADRCRPTTLLLLGGAAAIVRWTILGTTTSLPWLFASSWLHALTFGCTYLGSLRALDRRVPAHQRVTAQGLLGAATSGVGMVVGGLVGGFAYQRWEGRAFLTMAAFAGLGLLLAWRLRRQADAASSAATTSAPSTPA